MLKTNLILELPLPPRASSPNRRGHWSKHSGARAAYRRDCFHLCKRELQGLNGTPLPFDRIHIQVIFNVNAGRTILGKPLDGLYRPRDTDNAVAALKTALDSIIDTGLVTDDRSEHVSWGSVEIVNDSTRPPGVRMTIECFQKLGEEYGIG